MTVRLLDPALVPHSLRTDRFTLEPLQARHNERDHAAWSSSIDHIRSTPGFGDGTWGPDTWPYEMTAEQNLADLEMHWGEFQRGEAFAYTVLDPADGDVIGCVYIDPDEGPVADERERGDAMVRCWVRASNHALDQLLVDTVSDWLASSWPFARVRWPGRDLTETKRTTPMRPVDRRERDDQLRDQVGRSDGDGAQRLEQ